jgi:hypothetical protein
LFARSLFEVPDLIVAPALALRAAARSNGHRFGAATETSDNRPAA